MKFKEFGKALLLSALSAGVVLGVTSCAQSYSVGYLYVTGTETADSSGAGIVSGFRIDHNTGKLTAINGLPVSSGGANPVRAVLLDGSTFLYVLNRGTSSNPAGTSICTTKYPCSNYNITQFSVGANGSLTEEQVYCAIQTAQCSKPILQGINPTRLIADSTGTHLYVLDHDSPNTASESTAANGCYQALGTTTCGDITAFSIDSTTGLLSLIQNSGTLVNGQDLTYFPVPSNPVDSTISGGYIFTLYATTNADVDSTTGAYTGGSWVFPYAYSSTSGLLTAVSSGQSLGISEGTAIVTGGSYVYVLDNEAGSTSAHSQILAYGPTIGANGALQAATNSVIPDDVSEADPIDLVVENKGSWFYVANQKGVGTDTATGGIAGYVINNPFDPTEISGSPFGSGSGPQCIVEDPSNQFFYEANFNDSTVTGQKLDNNAGVLTPFSQSYALKGPATWCLVDGRTD
jgi:6-phosphogluconolactonase (cycloisomerase 2 family)